MAEDDWPGQRLHQYAIFDRDDSLRDLLMGDEIKNIDAPDMCQRTPLFTAVSNNSTRCLELLLKHGGNCCCFFLFFFTFKVDVFTFRGSNLLPLFSIGVNSERKECAQLGADLILKGSSCPGQQKGNYKSCFPL